MHTTPRGAFWRPFFVLLCCLMIAGSIPSAARPASAAAPLTLTVAQHGDRATIAWSAAVNPAEGWWVGRDGKDSGGYGAWSTTVPGSLRSWTFNHLIRGATYNFTLKSSVGGGILTIVAGSLTDSPTPGPIVRPLPSTAPATPRGGHYWLSGVATRESGNGPNPAKYFGDWRGAPVEIGQTWPHTPDVWGVNPAAANSWAGFTGPMSLSFSPGPDWQGLRGWRSYAAIAAGEMDAWWRAAAQNTRKLRAGKGATYVSPFYEYNGDWMAWSVRRTPPGYADFREAWARVSRIWRQEFSAAKLVLPAACSRDVPVAMMPDPSTYDLVGCTTYNSWPWKEDGGPAMRLLEAGRQRAQAAGKPFAITEWANSANARAGGGGGEAAGFISAMHEWLRRNAGTGSGQVVFETFFNIDGYDLDHILLRWNGNTGSASLSQSRTAARYRELWTR